MMTPHVANPSVVIRALHKGALRPSEAADLLERGDETILELRRLQRAHSAGEIDDAAFMERFQSLDRGASHTLTCGMCGARASVQTENGLRCARCALERAV